MAKSRDRIRMSEAEAWAYIERQRDMHVATIGKDGTPHLTTNWFAIVDGKVAFNTYESSQKAVNLRRDPRLTVLFADGRMYNELRGVSLKGRARFVSDPDEIKRVFQAIHTRSKPFHGNRDTSPAEQRVVVGKRVCIVIDVERMISWDHSKL